MRYDIDKQVSFYLFTLILWENKITHDCRNLKDFAFIISYLDLFPYFTYHNPIRLRVEHERMEQHQAQPQRGNSKKHKQKNKKQQPNPKHTKEEIARIRQRQKAELKQQREILNALYDTVADKIQALKEKKKKKKQDRAVKEEEKIWYDSVQRGDTDIIQYDTTGNVPISKFATAMVTTTGSYSSNAPVDGCGDLLFPNNDNRSRTTTPSPSLVDPVPPRTREFQHPQSRV